MIGQFLSDCGGIQLHEELTVFDPDVLGMPADHGAYYDFPIGNKPMFNKLIFKLIRP